MYLLFSIWFTLPCAIFLELNLTSDFKLHFETGQDQTGRLERFLEFFWWSPCLWRKFEEEKFTKTILPMLLYGLISINLMCQSSEFNQLGYKLNQLNTMFKAVSVSRPKNWFLSYLFWRIWWSYRFYPWIDEFNSLFSYIISTLANCSNTQ